MENTESPKTSKSNKKVLDEILKSSSAASVLKISSSDSDDSDLAILTKKESQGDPANSPKKPRGGLYVTKRDGTQQAVHWDKITERIEKLTLLKPRLDAEFCDPAVVSQKVINGFSSGMKTSEIDTLAAQIAESLTTKHPDYGYLASRIAISNLQKSTPATFSEAIKTLYENVNSSSGMPQPLIADDVYDIVIKNADVINARIKPLRDYRHDYMGFKTLEKSYLLRSKGQVVERPQYMWMRVAIGLHRQDLEKAFETYDLMSQGYMTHATPTLFNSATQIEQMSSCFVLPMVPDNLEGITKAWSDCALISKGAGGIGLPIYSVRPQGSPIHSSGGLSSGIVPMCQVFNNIARYIDQGGKRKGSFAVYSAPWHSDIFDFLELRLNHGKQERRARDLFLGLWVSDLFMERVASGGDWSLFCPDKCPEITDSYGDEFKKHYEEYERKGYAMRTIKARELWSRILEVQVETGTPYILFKDAVNRKSNHKHCGTVKSSNLCTEIQLYTDDKEVAVCNLASIALSRFVKEDRTFDFDKLQYVVSVLVTNLNMVIDRNFYPIPETRASNMRHRPIGLGVQGLADCFVLMNLPYDSDEARKLNRDIFETIYYAALKQSCKLAQRDGPYPAFAGSPTSKGQLQFDLWGVEVDDSRHDWTALKKEIVAHGLRNSNLVAPMPTASTANILGNNECFDPFISMLQNRRLLSGEFSVVNKHLVKSLIKLKLWSSEIQEKIIASRGSIQNITEIPSEVRALFKTVWEIKGKVRCDMYLDRAIFVDQSQSFNVFQAHPTTQKLQSSHFYMWKRGAKNAIYYLRTKSASNSQAITVSRKSTAAAATSVATTTEGAVCNRDDPDCEACGS